MKHGSLVRPPDVSSRLTGMHTSAVACTQHSAVHKCPRIAAVIINDKSINAASSHHGPMLPKSVFSVQQKGKLALPAARIRPTRTSPLRSSSLNEHNVYSYLGLEEGFHEQYTLGEVIGKGGFGTVYLAACQRDGVAYAAKVIPKWKQGACQMAKIKREVQLWTSLQTSSQSIVKLHKLYEDEDSVYLVQELLRGGSLLDTMKSKKSFTELECAQVCTVILEVLAACHDQDICYGDLKPANIMFNEPLGPSMKSNIKVVDFGCSQKCNKGEMLSQFTGTPRYMAPEIYLRSYGVKSDMWGAGIILYEMLCGSHPLFQSNPDGSDPTKYQWTKWLLSKPLSFSEGAWGTISAEAIELIQRMLDRDLSARITPQEALNHPWFAKVMAKTVSSSPLPAAVVNESLKEPEAVPAMSCNMQTVFSIAPAFA